MKIKLSLGICALALLTIASSRSSASARPTPMQADLTFEELGLCFEVDLPSSWRLERNEGRLATPFMDSRAELVLLVRSQQRFTSLRMLDGERRTLLELALPGVRASGLAQIELEHEGATLAELLHDYPSGRYLVEATTPTGERIVGFTTLSTEFPGAFALLSPKPTTPVPMDAVKVAWTPARAADHYVLEIESDELGMSFEIELPATQTAFEVPAALLQPGQPYDISLTVRGDTDNELEVEGGFWTAQRTH
jgi:hypothetical protein